MKIQLTHSKSSRERYYLISGSMGNYGTPTNHANNKYQIVNGIDHGNGYQVYISVSYFLTLDYIPKSVKSKLTSILDKEQLIYND